MSQFSGNNDIQDWDERPITPVNMPIGTNSSADLKSQLSQLQQKLNLNSIRPMRPSPNAEPEIHLPPLATLSNSKSNSLGNSKRTPDKSVDFLGDLSDSLLMESRKLSYENKQYKKQVSTLSAENESMKKQISNLNLLNKKLGEKEEQSNDKIWNLETELGNLKKSVEKTKSDLAKVKSENIESTSLIEQLKSSTENLTNEKQSLVESTNSTISKLNSQLSELKESNENLNDENDILHKNILELKNQVNTLKSEISESNGKPDIVAESSFSEFDDSIIHDPLPANLTDDLSKLDTETLQKNLKSSYRQLLRLKAQNTKFKSELLKLRHQSPSPKKSQFLPKNFNDENDIDSSWGNYEDDSFAKQPTKRNISSSLIRSVEDEGYEGEEDAEDAVVGDDTSFLADVSQLDGSSPVSTRKSSLSRPKDSYILIVPKTTLELANNDINLKKIDLSEFETVQISNSIANELLTASSSKDDKNNHFINDASLQLIPSADLNSLKSSIESPPIDYIKSKSLYHDHISISSEEHKKLISAAAESAEKISRLENLYDDQARSLADIEKQLDHTSADLTTKTEEFNSLKLEHETPSIDYIKSKLPLHNLVSLDAQSHENIIQRVENLQKRIQESNNNLASLKETIEHLKSDKSNLEAKLRSPDLQYMKDKSTVMHYVFIPESEHIELQSKLTVTEAKLKEKESEVEELVDEKAKVESKITELQNVITELKASSAHFESKLKTLETFHETPDSNYLKNKLSKHGLLALPIGEHNDLKKENSLLNDKMQKLSAELDSAKSENTKLSSTLNEKEAELKSFKVEVDSLVEEIEKVKKEKENPDAEYIKSKASFYNLTAIPMEEHQSLKEKLSAQQADLEDYDKLKVELKSKHDEIQQLIGSKEKLSQFIETATENVKQRETELETLKQELESPSYDYIKEKSLAHGFATITKEEHDKLKAELSKNSEALAKKESELESLHRIKEDLQRQGSKSVSLEFHQSVQSDLDNAKQELTEHKKQIENLKQIEIALSEKESELATLAQKTLELETKAAKVDEISFELQNLKNAQEDLNKKESELGAMKVEHEQMQEKITALECKETQLVQVLEDLEAKKSELKSLNASYEKPDFQYIKEKSESLGYIPITVEEHSLSKATLTKIETGNKKIAELEDTIISLSTKNNELTELNATLEESVKNLTELKKLLENPDIDYITERSANLGLVSIPATDHDQLQSQTETLASEIETLKSKIDVVETEKAELNQKIKNLESLNASPSAEYIKSKSASLGFIPVPITEHTSLKSDLERKDILLKESNQQLAELDALRKDISDRKLQLKETISKLDAITSSYDTPTLDYLQEKLATFSCVALPQSDLDDLNKAKENSAKQLEVLKQKLIASEKELGQKDEQLKQLSAELLAAKKTHESDNLKPNDQCIIEVSPKLSASLTDDVQKGIEMNKSSSVATVTSANMHDILSQSIDSIISHLEKKGYTVISTKEYENILRGHDNDVDLDGLADISHEVEDIGSDLESKKHILEELETKSRSSTISSSSSIQSTSISVENILSQKYNNLNNLVNSLSKEIEDLKREKVKTTKQMNRLSVSADEFANKKLLSKITKKIANIDDKIEVKEIELKSQQSALIAVKAYLERSRGMDLPSVTTITAENNSSADKSELEKEIALLQSKYNEKKQKMEKLVKEINDSSEPSQLVERLSLLGYTFTSPSGHTTMIKEILFHGYKLPLSSIIKSNGFDPLSGTLTFDKLADEHGLTLVTAEEAQRKPNILDAADLSLKDLNARASELNATVISNQKLSLIIAKSNEPKLPASFTPEELQRFAEKLNLRVISNEDIERLKERSITMRELAAKVEELNLVLLSQDEVKDLKTHEPVTKENIIEKGKEIGYLCIPSSQFVATTVSRTADIPNVTVLPNSYYKILTKSHEWYKKNKDKLGQQPVKQPQHIPEDDSFDLPSVMPNATPSGSQLPVTNIDAVSLHTVDTVISNKKMIIAAVTQTIIGEYIYKYYRKLGPFTSVSDTRHERFFWVHPYSMTLYWSPTNPVISDPAKNQIKAISILDVQCVNDNNPLPPGIYHKSIIIKSHDKNIKITCPTRQIHNIWYNSLKYLLERSMDSWVNDDDLEDQYQQDFTLDSKTRLERSQSQKLRRNVTPSTGPINENRPSKSTSLRSIAGIRR